MARYLLVTNSEDRTGRDLAKIRHSPWYQQEVEGMADFQGNRSSIFIDTHRPFSVEDFIPPKRLSTKLHLSESIYVTVTDLASDHFVTTFSVAVSVNLSTLLSLLNILILGYPLCFKESADFLLWLKVRGGSLGRWWVFTTFTVVISCVYTSHQTHRVV